MLMFFNSCIKEYHYLGRSGRHNSVIQKASFIKEQWNSAQKENENKETKATEKEEKQVAHP